MDLKDYKRLIHQIPDEYDSLTVIENTQSKLPITSYVVDSKYVYFCNISSGNVTNLRYPYTLEIGQLSI